MIKYLGQYVSEFEKDLNIPLMNKSYDRPLREYIEDAWKSLEIVKNIKILKFEYTDKESEIDINKYIFKREKGKRKKDRFDFKIVNDDRFARLTTYIQISTNELDPKTNEVLKQRKVIKKDLLIPLQDEDGYFQIKGKKYYMIYQLVDKSTYTTASSVTLKSLMPICVTRGTVNTESVTKESITTKDIKGTEYRLPTYSVSVFRKPIPVILFYAANGMTWALSYLGVDNILRFIANLDKIDTDKNLYFKISSKCYIEVNKRLFLKYTYVQAIVGMFIDVSSNRMTVADMENKNIWIKKISNNNSVEKGEDVLVFFNRLIDETTKKILMLSDYNKEDVYAVLRWIMQNFNELRMKDNLSLNNKRLRCNEYIASLLTEEFSRRVNRIITLGAKATMGDYQDMFKFSGEILLQKMHSSGILRFDENINDMDFFSKFKYTTKGPHSLGGKNENNISVRYRGLHPSFIGNIDLLVCGNSDPGTSGVLSPFGKIEGLYFDDSKEADNFRFNFQKDVSDIMKEEGVEYLEVDLNNKDDYVKLMEELNRFTNHSIKVFGTSKDEYKVYIENDVTPEEAEK